MFHVTYIRGILESNVLVKGFLPVANPDPSFDIEIEHLGSDLE